MTLKKLTLKIFKLIIDYVEQCVTIHYSTYRCSIHFHVVESFQGHLEEL